MSSVRIQHRVDAKLKADVEKILKIQGIKPTQAITIFYTEIKRTGGFPFLPSTVPNEKLALDIREAEAGKGVKTYKNKKDFFDALKAL